MKKTLVLLLVMLLCVPTAALADFPDVDISDSVAEAIFDVSSLGIMEGFEDGSFRPDDKLTRAQFAKIAVTAMGIKDAPATETIFSDVPSSHWASGFVKFASDTKLINGVGNGLFAPESEVVLQDAIKIIVGVLGRNAEAEALGGYPSGYLAVAYKCDMTDGITTANNMPITRGDAAQLISNALDANIMESDYLSDNNYSLSNDTLRDVLLRVKDAERIEGIVTANQYTSINSSDEVDETRIEIDGVSYKATKDFSEFLGYSVIAYVSDGRTKEIISIQKYNNEETVVNADDVSDITADTFKWFVSDDKEDKMSIRGAEVIYNGKYKSSLPTIYNGTYTLVDNNDDNKADVVFVKEYESFIVKKASYDSVYFDNDAKFKGKSAFKFDSKDHDAVYIIEDFGGNAISVDEIEQGMSITLSASEDNKLVEAIIGDKTVEGTVSALSGDSSFIEIDGEEYVIVKDSNGNIPFTAKLGDKGKYALDKSGRIINVAGDIDENEMYGYVIAASRSGGIANVSKIKVLKSGTKEKITEIINDTEIVKYEYANSDTIVLEFASKVSADGVSETPSSLNADDFVGKVIEYTLNADGKIRKLTSHEVPGGTSFYNFNGKLHSIGGYVGKGAYFIDEYTDILCVPESPDSEEDWFELVTLAHNGTYNIKPVVVDEESQKAKAVVVVSKMDAESLKPFEDDTKVSIVWSVSGSLIDGEEAYKITMLTGEEIEEVYTKNSGIAFETALTLRKGDLIKYSLDSHDKLSNIQIMASIQGLDEFYRAYENSPRETVYAMVNSIAVDKLSEMRNEIVDELTVVFKEDGSGQIVSYDLPKEDGPTVYKYNPRTGDVSYATTDEISSFEDVGSFATKIFMTVSNNDVQTVVIIEK